MAPAEPVVIVGGGLAGLAAAVGLATAQVPTIVLESRPRLGGRASSFPDPGAEQWVDNCQHVAMGCCTNFRWWCETVGAWSGFRREPELYFLDPRGFTNRFAATRLPAPFHLAAAFARLSYLTLREKLGLALALRQLASPACHDDSRSFADWLATQNQSPATIQRFWTVVLVSALSESLDRISLQQARKVFVDGFLTHRDGWSVEIPLIPFDELYEHCVAPWLTARATVIRRLTAAQSLILDPSVPMVRGVRLKSGEELASGDVIVAVPWHRVGTLLPTSVLATDARLAGAGQLEAAPISSLHFWFDRSITPLPHAVFVDGLVQWVFNRSALESARQPATVRPAPVTGPPDTRTEPQTRPHADAPALAAAHYYQVVISASREVLAQDSATVRQRVLDELAQVWPIVREATLLHARQVTEHRAVYSVLPGTDARRPPQQTAFPNLQVAGDWTQTGWPATMEGAVRSGLLAAENVLQRRGLARPLVQPDLPVAWWSRMLFGLANRPARRSLPG